jgi:allophanate hydrolase
MSKIPVKLTVCELREKYLSGQLTAFDVIDEIITRAQRFENKNIFIIPPEKSKLEPYLKKLETLDIDTHPLWGIPFTVKDNIDVEGFPTTAGCPDYSYMPNKNAGVVQRLIEAGAIPVGKANLDQFATGLVGTRSPHGATHNALRDELISGGSSSGSAVAVALGISSFSLGTDTAGSGRVPAALNGLYGFKPSCGAWPTNGVVPACASLDCVTVFAHTMKDCLAVDAVARGFLPSDPWSKKMPPVTVKMPKKILVPKNMPEFFGMFADEYKSAWEKALTAVSKCKLPIEQIELSDFEEAAKILYGGPWVAERWADLGDFVKSHPGKVFPVTEKVLRSGEKPDAASLFKAIHKLQALKSKVRGLLADAVMIMPTAGGTWTIKNVEDDPIATNTLMGSYTNHCNLLDFCACSIPVAMAAENLPFGITAFALSGAEGLIAAFSQQLDS